MTRRLANISSYFVDIDNTKKFVTIEKLRNDVNGNPRYKGVIICYDDNYTSFYTPVYTFSGYFASEAEAAEYIVLHHKTKGGV